MSKNEALHIDRLVVQGYCDTCAHLKGGDTTPPECTRLAVLVCVEGTELRVRELLTPEQRAQARSFHPAYIQNSFGCTHWAPEDEVTVARSPTLKDLEGLKGRLSRWRERWPEQFDALFLPRPGPRMEWRVMERLRFADGDLYLGLLPHAVTRAPLFEYARNLA